MSVISNIHTAIVYEAKGANKSQPFEGQRGVVTIAKADKNGNYGPNLQQTMFTSIPVLSISDIDFTDNTIKGICVDYLKKIQNEIVADNIKSGQKSIRTEDINQDAIVSYIFSESVGDKWDENRVAQWFTDNLAIPMTEKLLESNTPDDKIESKLETTGKRFAEIMSSKSTKIPANVAEALTRVMKLAENDLGNDVIYKRFYAKLNPPTVKEALDIGF
jgi:hypothetical protein